MVAVLLLYLMEFNASEQFQGQRELEMQFLYSIFVLQMLKYQQKMSLPPSVFLRHRAESNAEITTLLRLYLLHVIVRHLYRVPREMVDGLSLETFQVRLDGALTNLLWLKMPLLIAGCLNEMSFGSSFQPQAIL